MKKTALITGASSGIGKALAFVYARNGFDLLIVGRNMDALNAVAVEAEQKFDAKTEIFTVDLSDDEATQNLINSLNNREIHTLVNNAGFAVKGRFIDTDLEQELKMIDLQLAAMLRLTKAVLPSMVAKGDGRIVNIASVYSFSAVPRQSVYSACKSFMLGFSAALNNELEGTGVFVTAVCPGTTKTEFRTRAGIDESGTKGMTAEAVAEISFNASHRGKPVVVPGFWNKAFAVVSKHLPLSTAASLVSRINDKRGVNK